MTTTIPDTRTIDAVIFDPVLDPVLNNGRLTARLLEANGIHVIPVYTLEELRRAAAKLEGSVVYITDPSTGSGFDSGALTVLHEAKVPDDKVLLMIASYSPEMAAYDTISKPCKQDDLMKKIKELQQR